MISNSYENMREILTVSVDVTRSVFLSCLGKMNVLKSKNEGEWHPHGCVRLDLSELWLGQTALEFDVPVVPCDGKQVPTGSKRNRCLVEDR